MRISRLFVYSFVKMQVRALQMNKFKVEESFSSRTNFHEVFSLRVADDACVVRVSQPASTKPSVKQHDASSIHRATPSLCIMRHPFFPSHGDTCYASAPQVDLRSLRCNTRLISP